MARLSRDDSEKELAFFRDKRETKLQLPTDKLVGNFLSIIVGRQ